MGRILLFVFLGGLGVWAYSSASSGPRAVALDARAAQNPQRVTYVPIVPYIPPSNRTGSARGPRVGGGGFSSGK